jgi:hypothetical protein
VPAQEADLDGVRVLDQEDDEENERYCGKNQPDVQAAEPGWPPTRGLVRLHYRRCRRGSGGRSNKPAHATDCFSQRRQVSIARVTRRSHSGQVADISRLAFDQNANVDAGIGPRQYTHGRLELSCAREVLTCAA